MKKEGTLNRDVTIEECFWLEHNYPAGTPVKQYTGPTYGCISEYGEACLIEEEKGFIELPKDAIVWKTEETPTRNIPDNSYTDIQDALRLMFMPGVDNSY